jgi:hypothetical protein
VKCFQQEETQGKADLALMLAKWRDSAQAREGRQA